ncbi:MAG: ATP-binding protein [candidate division KSB1 bacterium]|nr:ATP-binding protein [candidate division KSB1 bacterium]
MIYKVDKEQLRVPAHIDYLADLREFVTKIGRKYHLSEKLVKNFKLAIDEAATNIIRHAYRGTKQQGYITLRAVVRKTSVTFSLIDQGKYFDPTRVTEPDLNRYVAIGKKGGIGHLHHASIDG